MSGYIPLTISLEERFDLDIVETINKRLSELKSRCQFGTETRYLQVIDIALKNLYETLSIMENYHSWFYFWSSKKNISPEQIVWIYESKENKVMILDE